MPQRLGNRLFVLLVLTVCSAWLIGCGASGLPATAQPFRTPTSDTSAAIKTSAPTNTPAFTPTLVRLPTNTLVPTPKPSPTLTPTPTPQPIPTLALPPGWKKLESAQIELWVPGTFVGGDPIKDRDRIAKSLQALGPEYEGTLRVIDQNPSPFAIYAIDTNIGSTGFVTSITVTVNQIVSAGTVETLVGGVTQQLPRQYNVLDRRSVMLYYSAERMVTDAPVLGFRLRQLVYTIKSPNTAWIVAYSTAEGEFFARLPAFEQSIQTLRIRP